MHPLRVVVARPFQYKFSQLLLVLSLLIMPVELLAQTEASLIAGGYIARINQNSPDEVADALERAEMLFEEGVLPKDADPVAIVLHGPEVEVFFKDKYDEYKNIVDLAQRLSELGIVDVKVCETRSGILGRSRSSIHPFIGTVVFAPTELDRLLRQQNYVYF